MRHSTAMSTMKRELSGINNSQMYLPRLHRIGSDRKP